MDSYKIENGVSAQRAIFFWVSYFVWEFVVIESWAPYMAQAMWVFHHHQVPAPLLVLPMPCAHPCLLCCLHPDRMFARPSSSQCYLAKLSMENTATFMVGQWDELGQCHVWWMPRQVKKWMDRNWNRKIFLLRKPSWHQPSHLTEGCPWSANLFDGFLLNFGHTGRNSKDLVVSHSLSAGVSTCTVIQRDSPAEGRNSSQQNQGRGQNGCVCFETSLIQGILWQCN